jgi:LmbE family N-acetylglucosaminyl deacetylase
MNLPGSYLLFAQCDHHLCVISPHLDDAAFSTFSSLSSPTWLSRSVVTVFTAHGRGLASAEEELRARCQEDKAALHSMGVAWTHLGASGDNPERTRTLLLQEICNRLEADPRTCVLLPAGAGRALPLSRIRRLMRRALRRPPGAPVHAEHAVVRDMSLEVMRTLGHAEWAFYAENPYIWNDNIPELKQRLERLTGTRLTAFRMKPDPDRKLQVAELYESQVAPILGTRRSYRRRMLAHDEVYFRAMIRTLS